MLTLRAALALVSAIMTGWWIATAAAQPLTPAASPLDPLAVAAAPGCDPSYPDFCIPPPPPDLNCSSPVIAGRHNFRALPPDPHHFDTDSDGVACEAALTDTPTPTSVVVATATFTPTTGGLPTATATVGVPVFCTPRPPVRVAVTRGPSGQFQATLTATSNPSGGTNTVSALTFGAIRNATVQVVGVGPAQSGQRVAIAAGAQVVTLGVTRTVAGQTVFVPVVVSDACGEWRTFVGGGPSAF
jgi:hypothetical protein